MEPDTTPAAQSDRGDQGVINVVASCDSGFAQHLAVMLVSLLESNPGERFRVFILTTASPEALSRLLTACSGYDVEIVPLGVNPRCLEGVPVSGHVTQAAYYRVLLGELLPADVTRVLYLDADIVIAGPIGALWHQDLGGRVVGAVVDELRPAECRRKLELSDAEPYFNSGVLLIDLRRWRDEGVGQAALDFARNEPHRITWWDQCALNFVLRGRWLPLDRRWNLQTHALGEFAVYEVICNDEGRARLLEAAVIHFTTHSKPWHFLCGHPAKHRYWHYLRKTPWRDYRMRDLTAGNVARKLLTRYGRPLLRAYWNMRR